LRNALSFQDLKTYNYGKFVTIVGIIVRTSDIKPFCTNIAFICLKCQTIQICNQDKGSYTQPSRCIGVECHSTNFRTLLKSPLTQTIPWKTVRLQELNINQDEGGHVPRSIECELHCQLTETCIPGDVVAVSGILSLNNLNEKKAATSRDACTYTLYIKANSVTCLKGKNIENKDAISNSIHFKTEDLSIIKQIHSENNLFQLMVASLCPNIYGHELIKAGIILALFGGTFTDEHEQKFSIRENSHILIVGDPGLGKSQMLLATSSVSPRGVYVCGNSTTTSGLTVTITKEGGGDNSLEAGALVLADQGHCCIDEFDKMMHQHSALLEAMEQQTISMAKSGVVCTLPARTSIIAAANPSGGHYNKAKTVSENLKISGSLLSRFDLVFIIQDRPDQMFDSKMSEHVMGLHMEMPKQLYTTPSDNFDKSQSICNSLNDSNQLLRKLQANERINPIPHKMLQKYISYARKFSQPKLTPEVSVILQNFYIEMRKQHKIKLQLNSYNNTSIRIAYSFDKSKS
ncbi:DNA helicase MCM8, partial [Caerostris extrusa]